MSGSQLALALPEPEPEPLELVDGTVVESVAEAEASAAVLSPPPPPTPPGLEGRNLFAEAQRIAAQAASASTRRQYATIFRSFGDWLAAQLGRAPVVGDLDADVIAAYGRHLAAAGGRDGRPAAPATVRVYLSMIRALVRDLDRAEQTAAVRIPRHEPGPPETLTDTDYANYYANLLRVPDRRSLTGKRDRALDRRAPARARRRSPGRAPAVRPAWPSRRRAASPPLRLSRASPRAPDLPGRGRARPARASTCLPGLLGHPLP